MTDVSIMMICVFDRGENIMGKGENAAYHNIFKGLLQGCYALPRWISGERVGPGGCEFDPQLRQTFSTAYFCL